MRAFLTRPFLTLAALFTLAQTPLLAQSPFQFREGYLLENRVFYGRIGSEYDQFHRETTLVSMAPSLSLPFLADSRNELTYKTNRWLEILSNIDKNRRMGGLGLAETQYLYILSMLRKVRGPADDTVCLMLDHLAEFYLETRSFDRAHEVLAEAIQLKRSNIQALSAGQADPTAARTRIVYRSHLADMLTRIGQIELAKGDFAAADRNLSEAVSICNEAINRPFVTGLYATYFQSLVFERQSKWQQAEDLWKDAVKLREPLMVSDMYWDAVKEFAAFYARHGDFHQAAVLAAQAEAGTVGKTLRPEAALLTQLDSRPRIATHSQYRIESDAAMNEILAIDKWQTDGPDAAAALLPDIMKAANGFGLDQGSDSDRAQVLAWFEQRVFLHMSILLDGNPSQDRVNKAYELLSNVKGRFFAATIESTRSLELERGNPHVTGSKYHMLDELADARTAHAHTFLASALDGKEFNGLEFAGGENQERALVEAIIANGSSHGVTYSRFSLPSLIRTVPANSALIDMVVWERIKRTANAPPAQEYGAFVVRNNQPVQYVGFGPAADIDNDITALNARVLGNRLRGVRLPQQTSGANSDEVQQRLKSLYSRVIAPMDKLLQGAAKVLIVPDGKLTLTPVGAFMDPAGHYFLESHTITYLNSWRDIVSSYAYQPGESSLPVIVASPDFDSTFGESAGSPGPDRLRFTALSGAELEARDVQKALNLPAGRVLTGKMAREEIVRSLVSPEILHFATHSVPYLHWNLPVAAYNFFEFPQSSGTEDPLLQSVVALAGANLPHTGTEDGLLTGLEIASLHLAATRLVVLSSCESAQGTPLDGQGVLGMRAAVSMSGAEMLVMSLWPVDDQAGRQFMQFFYSHLAEGPAEAVRLAQIDLRTKTEFKDPFYWAGYSASGNSHSGETKPPPVDNHETFASPDCFEFSSHHDQGSDLMRYLNTVRFTMGGVVRRQQPDPSTVIYELTGAGTDVVDSSTASINHGPPALNPDVMRASLMEWPITLTIERQKDSSSLSIRVRNPPTPPRVLITLKGGPGLFPTFDIPDTLPPVASYTQATVLSGGMEGVIDKIGFCRADSQFQ